MLKPQKEIFDFLGNVDEVHMAEIEPGAVRGNHYHKSKKEVMVVWYADNWSFGWQSAEETKTKVKDFNGRGAMIVEIAPEAAHAIKNSGDEILRIIAFSDKRSDPRQPDTHRKVLL